MTPLTTADDNALKAIMTGAQPVVLYLHDGTDNYKPTSDAVRKLAKKHSDDITFASVNLTDNPTAAAKYGNLKLPALMTFEKKLFGMREKSASEETRPADVRAHVAFLLGEGEDPAIAAANKVKAEAATAGTKDVSERTFKRDVLKSKVPVLVDFWAPWCGPCQQVSPVIEQLGEEYAGKVQVVKINVDDNPSLSRKYNIMSIPTVMVFKDGTKVDSTVGAQSKGKYQKMLENALL